MKVKRVLKWGFLTILVAFIAWLFVSYWTSTNDCEQITKNPTHSMKAILSCEYGVGNLHCEKSKSRHRLTTKFLSASERRRLIRVTDW